MHRAEGPLTTGTYLITRPNNEDLLNTKERSNGAGHELTSTMNRNHESIEVRTMSATPCISHPSFIVAF